MANIDYPSDVAITARTDTTLESSDMTFAGCDGSGNPLKTDYSDIKTAILAAIPTRDYILVRDVKSADTDGGTFTSGSDQTRALTEITSDSGGHASLSTNQVTLVAGTYEFHISVPAYRVDAHKAKLYNVTDTALSAMGQSAKTANSAGNIATCSMVSGVMTIAESKTFEVRHRCQTTFSTSGMGLACNFGSDDEVYTVAEFWRAP